MTKSLGAKSLAARSNPMGVDSEVHPSGTWIVAGLGNIGRKYIGTRHNIGFAVLDRWLSDQSGNFPRKNWTHSETATVKRGEATLLACWPSTFMNLSGDAIQELAAFYNVSVGNIIVIHDDIDLPCGKLRVRKGGGDGGQKGVRSTIERINSADFIRVKVGVGRPEDPRFEIADWVLSKFSGDERERIEAAIGLATKAIDTIISKGAVAAQNQYNRDPA